MRGRLLYIKKLQKGRRLVLFGASRLSNWWWRNDRRYDPWWRLGNIVIALVLIFSVILPLAQQFNQASQYSLSAATQKLIGMSQPQLMRQLKYDANTQSYEFNQQVVQESKASGPLAAMEAQVGAASGKKGDKSLYGLTLPTDFSQGLSYTDANTKLSFKLVPQFSASSGELNNGHIIYPLNGGKQAIYTFKDNGLKEDIVVQNPKQETLTYGYKLDLPKTLAAKVIPDSGGDIGIYSADPALFGHISFGDSKDQAAVQQARIKGAKTHLVFGLPAPVIKDEAGNNIGSAHFKLRGGNLTVVANLPAGVSKLGPVSIDPSVTIASASDFATGNNEDNISFGTSGGISRGGLIGGTISGGWSSPVTAGNTGNYGVGSAAYNGYLYDIGGNSATKGVQALYAAINGDGSITTWNTTTSLPVPLEYPSAEVYNGYLYVYGGYNWTTAAESAAVYSIPINSNGTLGTTWTQTSSMLYAVCRQASAIYNGYLYSLGGEISAPTNCGNTGTPTTYTQYAPINANGSVGTWQSTNAFTYATTWSPNGVFSGGSFAYNGYIYMMGGTYDGAHNYKTIQYARLNADGSIGTWITNPTTLPYLDYRFGLVAYNGYMYYLRGSNSTGETDIAPINANGSIGTLQTSVTLPVTRWGEGFVAYNGYLYVYNGAEQTGNNDNDTVWAKIDPAGETTSWSSTGNTAITGTITNAGVATYNGYIYVMGGYDGTNYSATTRYATLSTSGTIGAWTTVTSGTGALNTPVSSTCATIYNGYVYMVGGYTTGSVASPIVQYAPIDSNGSLGAWNTTTALANGVANQCPVAYNGYIYTVGTSGGGASNTVQYAQLSSSGGITGSWSNTSSLNTGREGEGMIAYGGYMYVVGGSVSGGTPTNSVEYAQINSSGTLGSWRATSSMGTSRNGSGAFVANGYIYAIGGTTSSGDTATTEYAPINTNGSVGTWVANTSFTPGTLSKSNVAYYEGYAYSVSGIVGGSRVSTAYSAAVNNGGSGTAGTWTTNGTNLYSTREDFGSVAYNGYLYVLGGTNGSGLSDVRYATLNSDGSVGAWTSGGTLPFSGATVAVTSKGYLYALSGGSGSSPTTFSYTGGAQSYLVPAGVTSLQIEAWGAQGGTSNGGLGGYAKATITTTPGQTLQVNVGGAGGSSGAGGFNGGGNDAGNMYGGGGGASDVRQGGTALSNRVVVAGGGGGGGGAVNPPNGGTGGGTTGGSPPAGGPYGGTQTVGGSGDVSGSLGSGAVAYQAGGGGGGYYGGGADGSGIPYGGGGGSGYVSGTNTSMSNGVQTGNGKVVITPLGTSTPPAVAYASINSGGSLGSWQTTNGFTGVRSGFAAAAYGGYVYVLGGSGSSEYSDVQYAPISTNGSLGSWHYTHNSTDDGTTFVSGFTTGRDGLATLAYGGYLYVIGGETGGAALNDVQYAPLNTNGTVGTWAFTTSLLSANANLTAFAYNGYLYISGGYTGTSSLSSVQYAPLNAGGSVGTWASTTSFANARYGAGSIASGGYLYIFGGYDGTSYYSDIQYTPLATIARVGHYSKLVDLGSAVNVTSLTYNSAASSGSVTVTYQAAGSNGVFGSAYPASNLSGSIGCIGNTTNTRYLFVFITLDDSSSGTFPDSAGSPANVTSFTVNYNPVHPPPNIRLRAGQTLQQGNLSPLDTCYP